MIWLIIIICVFCFGSCNTDTNNYTDSTSNDRRNGLNTADRGNLELQNPNSNKSTTTEQTPRKTNKPENTPTDGKPDLNNRKNLKPQKLNSNKPTTSETTQSSINKPQLLDGDNSPKFNKYPYPSNSEIGISDKQFLDIVGRANYSLDEFGEAFENFNEVSERAESFATLVQILQGCLAATNMTIKFVFQELIKQNQISKELYDLYKTYYTILFHSLNPSFALSLIPIFKILFENLQGNFQINTIFKRLLSFTNDETERINKFYKTLNDPNAPKHTEVQKKHEEIINDLKNNLLKINHKHLTFNNGKLRFYGLSIEQIQQLVQKYKDDSDKFYDFLENYKMPNTEDFYLNSVVAIMHRF